MIRIIWKGFIAVSIIFLAAACASVEEPVYPPEVISAETGVTDLSFSEVTLEKRLVLFNPNAVPVELTSCDSSLIIGGSSFLREEYRPPVQLAPKETLELTIPFILSYKDLYKISDSLKEKHASGYSIDTRFRYIQPAGEDGIEETFSAAAEGVVPLIKKPLYHFQRLYVNSLGMMGADITVWMYALNNNDFDITLKDFQGWLIVNNENWSGLALKKPVVLKPGEISESIFRFRLEFLSMGKTVRDLLSGEPELFYDFAGESLLETSVEFLEEETLGLALKGEIELDKPDTTTKGAHSSVKIENSIEENLLHIFGRYSP